MQRKPNVHIFHTMAIHFKSVIEGGPIQDIKAGVKEARRETFFSSKSDWPHGGGSTRREAESDSQMC